MARPHKKNNLQRFNQFRASLKNYLDESPKTKLPKGKSLNQVASSIYGKIKNEKGFAQYVKNSIDLIWDDFGPGRKKKGTKPKRDLDAIFNPLSPAGEKWDWIYFYDLGVKLDEAVIESGKLKASDRVIIDNSIMAGVDDYEGSIKDAQADWPSIISQIRDELKARDDIGSKGGVSVPYYIYDEIDDDGTPVIKFTLQYEIPGLAEDEPHEEEPREEEPKIEDEPERIPPPETPGPGKKKPEPPEEEEQKREKIKTRIVVLQAELDSVMKAKKEAREEMKEFKGDKELKEFFKAAKDNFAELSKREKEILKSIKDLG